MILLHALILIVGFSALIKGADWFVDGSSAMAKKFHVPGLIIGLTIVAFGTSAPELAVSTVAAFQGSNEIALSNVVGSNIFNLLCVLGTCALFHPVPVESNINKRDFPVAIGTTLLVLFGACGTLIFSGKVFFYDMSREVGIVSRPVALILLILFVCYIAYLIYDARKNKTIDETGNILPLWKSVILILIGIALIIAGGQAVVYAAKAIAIKFGMSETLVGLTIVAVGTSLPELVTSVVAAKKGETGMAIGNVVGSNIFNMLFILGISSAINPVAVNMASFCDLVILTLISIVAYIFAITKNSIDRYEGIAMLIIYIADVVFAAMR